MPIFFSTIVSESRFKPGLSLVVCLATATVLTLLMHRKGFVPTQQDYANGVRCLHKTCGQDCDKISSVVVFGVASVYHQAKEITRTLQAQAVLARQVTRVDELETNDNTCLYILLTPQLVPLYPKYFIAYQVEQWGAEWMSRPWGLLKDHEQVSPYAEVFEAAVEVWDYNRWNIEHFEYPIGFNRNRVKYVPFAWFPSNKLPATDARDIDVLFFGAMNQKREAMLSGIGAIGVNITIVTADEAELDAFVLRAKIVLNLHFYNGLLETSRVMHAISLKALVISEPTTDLESNNDFATSIVFDDGAAALANSILYFLEHDATRQEIIDRAYAAAQRKYALAQWLHPTCVRCVLNCSC